MSMLLDYSPGMSLTDPWVFTNSRATTGTFWDSLGVVRTAAAGVTRDRHYPLGPVDGRRTTLSEIGSTNSCLQSQALATTPWTVNVLTATNNAGAAPDLTTTATKLVPTAVSDNQHNINQPITITASENVAASGFFKAAGYNAITLRVTDSISSQFGRVFDLSTGTLGSDTSSGGTLTGSAIVPLANSWYWCAIWGTNGAVTTQSLRPFVFDTAAHANANTAYTGDATSGVFAWGLQFERWGTAITSPPTSYIATTTLTVARSADSTSTPWPFQTMPMWGYAKLIDLGWAQRAGFSRLVTLSNAAGAAPRFTIMTGVTSAGFAPGVYRHNYNTDFAVQSAATIASAVRGYGTPIELFWRLFTDQLAEISLSINGGAVTTVTSGGGSKLLDFITPTVLIIGASLNEGAQVGLQRLKLGAGTAPVTTLALAAAA